MTTNSAGLEDREVVQAILAHAGLASLSEEDTDWLVRAYSALHEQIQALRLPETEMVLLEPAVIYSARDEPV